MIGSARFFVVPLTLSEALSGVSYFLRLVVDLTDLSLSLSLSRRGLKIKSSLGTIAEMHGHGISLWERG